MKTRNKVLVGGAVLFALLLGALTGASLPVTPHGVSVVPAVYADDCDNGVPPPGLDCPPTPTPTPTPPGG
jgi:hypothetical protein